MLVNQAGIPVVSDLLFAGIDQLTPAETSELLLKLVEHLGLEAWRTNANSGWQTTIELRPANG